MVVMKIDAIVGGIVHWIWTTAFASRCRSWYRYPTFARLWIHNLIEFGLIGSSSPSASSTTDLNRLIFKNDFFVYKTNNKWSCVLVANCQHHAAIVISLLISFLNLLLMISSLASLRAVATTTTTAATSTTSSIPGSMELFSLATAGMSQYLSHFYGFLSFFITATNSVRGPTKTINYFLNRYFRYDKLPIKFVLLYFFTTILIVMRI